MLDQRGQLLRAAVGFAGCSMPSYDRCGCSARGSTPAPASATSLWGCTAKATTFS